MFDVCKVLKIHSIDIKYVVSIAALAKLVFLLSGCFHRCYEFSGHVQKFLQKCVIGGRFMPAWNKAYHVK